MREQVALLLLLLAHGLQFTVCLDNGLATTPWMGWSAWEVFRCTTCEQDPHNCLSEDLIRKTADAMVKWGFRDAGYTIVWIDDCWALKERNQTDGRLVPDPSRWPNGLKAVADYVHSLDMKLGLYGDIGTKTCAGFPGLGGLKHGVHTYATDAQQMAEWGIDAFKVDGCNEKVANMKTEYPALGQALNASGRPMIFSCSWPDYERSSSIPVNFSLVAEHCNSWRIFWDVQAGQYAHTQAQRYDCANGVMEFWGSGSTMAAEAFSPNCPGDCKNHPKPVDHDAMVAAAGPGAWNDADMLPIGTTFTMNAEGKKVPVSAFTLDQAYSAFAMWAMLASPLLIGADVREMSADFRSVWLNEEIMYMVVVMHACADGLTKTHSASKAFVSVGTPPSVRYYLRVTLITIRTTLVWLRHLDNGDELYVVLFNSGKGSCAPPSSAPSANATMQVTWQELGVNPECMMSTSELITGVYWGTIQGQLKISLRPGGSAAFRMHPHCHVPAPPPPPS